MPAPDPHGTRVVFVQKQVSQLDEPVYACMHALTPDSCAVIYWNDYGFVRERPDPHTGVVPDFLEPEHTHYPRTWLDSRTQGLRDLAAAILSFTPHLAVLADVPTGLRWRLARALRRSGVRVALRSDKNHLSANPARGLRLVLERALTRVAFDALAPTGPLTLAYYKWPRNRQAILFPYATNAEKFCRPPDARIEARRRVRAHLEIPHDAFVFVSAAKFHERENPQQLADSFTVVARDAPEAYWIALGDGPLQRTIREGLAKEALERARFPGFVPFRDLQDYFFAGDVFLHFPVVGPWEVSPQDALVAGMALVATETVGSAQVFLQGDERRFLVPVGDVPATAERMNELVARGERAAETVAVARSRTADYTVEATAARFVVGDP
jgi:glycosyltransferase involved in cell wall biosynthesis